MIEICLRKHVLLCYYDNSVLPTWLDLKKEDGKLKLNPKIAPLPPKPMPNSWLKRFFAAIPYSQARY